MALRPEPYHTLALCAGAGGLELGVELAVRGARCVAYVEREAYAAATLVARMEAGQLAPAPVWSDLATFDARPWRGRIHCVTSGDPCQGNSVAGLGLGEDDDRFLLDRAIDVFAASGAPRFFRENVTGNAHGQLRIAIPLLEKLGCRVAAGIVRVRDVGGSHKRERLILMADRGSCAGAVRGRSPPQPARGDVDPAGRRRIMADPSVARPPLGSFAEIGRGTLGEERQTAGAGGDDFLPILCPGPADARWPDIIARAPHLEPAVRRMADGLANRVDRLRLCGNGVHPLAAGYAWLALDALLATPAGSGASAVREAA